MSDTADLPPLHLMGLRALPTEADGSLGVEIVFIGENGRPFDRRALPVSYTAEQRAERDSALCFLASACRFINLGGSASQAVVLLDNLVEAAARLPVFSVSKDWCLWSTLEESRNQHFCERQGSFLRIVEDEFCELLTKQQYLALFTELPEDSFVDRLVERDEVTDHEEQFD